MQGDKPAVVKITGEVVEAREEIEQALEHARISETEWRETRRDLSAKLTMLDRQETKDKLARATEIERACEALLAEIDAAGTPALGTVERLREALL